MAERRMFTKKITESDAFLDMPLSTQALYFHLNMGADDDGFVNNAKRIQRNIGASDDDLKLLFAKNFIIPFETGVIVIKHWKMHNFIRADRKKNTDYSDEMALLKIKKNGAYTLSDELRQPLDNQTATKLQPNDNQMTTTCQPNDRIGKDRIGKDSIDKNNISSKDDMSDESDNEYLFNTSNPIKEDIEKVVNAWNESSFRPISRLSTKSKRYMMLRARILDYGVDAVIEAINNAKTSDYLKSEKAVSWFDFEWLVRPNNFIKVYEGKYNKNIRTEITDDPYANYQ